ncbi:MAG: hypothetical protein EP334_10635 [Gammaproteobacteria bacterium]|nr:MAG: hypothetical protein EP334_10635 [Gammaproteobacteria bacterium]
MHPFLPFASLPAAVIVAWFSASHWSDTAPGRYRTPSVVQIEEVSEFKKVQVLPGREADIRVSSFLPPIPPKPPAPIPTLILHSVMTGSDVRTASINGRIVTEGDQISGYKVMRIAANGVELERGDQTRRLPMRSLHELSQPVR